MKGKRISHGKGCLPNFWRTMINKESITDLFFDLDHTLWDFEKHSALTFKQLIADYKITVRLEDFLKVYVPLNLEYWKAFREQRMDKETLRYRRIKDTFDRLQISIDDDMVYTLADAYIQNLPEHNHLFPGGTRSLGTAKKTVFAAYHHKWIS